MWFQKEETITIPENADAVWETLQSLRMLDKHRQSIDMLEMKLDRTQKILGLTTIVLSLGLLSSLGISGWTLYQFKQLPQPSALTQSKDIAFQQLKDANYAN